MKLHGLQKLTLLDFPGHVACTVFTPGCNLRCPFCHTALLVTDLRAEDEIPLDEFFSFLEKRKGLLDGVAVMVAEVDEHVRPAAELLDLIEYRHMRRLPTKNALPSAKRNIHRYTAPIRPCGRDLPLLHLADLSESS